MQEVNLEELEKARQDNEVLQQKNEILSNVLESLQEDMRGLQVLCGRRGQVVVVTRE